MTNVTAMLERLDAGRILDVATGSGYFLNFITDTVKSYSDAAGIDTKEEAAVPFGEMFQQNPKVHFWVMPAEKMNFPDSSFDTVCIANSLHHLENPETVLCEMRRVLKPGGTFIISEMYCDGSQLPAQQTHILLHHWWGAVDRTQNIVHNETFTRRKLFDFAENLRLAQIEMEDQIDISNDPLDPEIFLELEPVIQCYLDRAAENSALRKQGEHLLERLRTIGFQSASSLLLLAKKG
jgi:ubiquinone/menaquinone biosynthesis C-methylase UbiE